MPTIDFRSYKVKYYKGRRLEIYKENIFKKIFLGKKDLILLVYHDDTGLPLKMEFHGMRDVKKNSEKRIEQSLAERREEYSKPIYTDPNRRYGNDAKKVNYTSSVRSAVNTSNTNNYEQNNTVDEYDEEYTREEKRVNITNQMYSMNRTNSPLTVEDITPDKYQEEFFYDLNNDYGTYMNTDADRNYSNSYDNNYDDYSYGQPDYMNDSYAWDNQVYDLYKDDNY